MGGAVIPQVNRVAEALACALSPGHDPAAWPRRSPFGTLPRFAVSELGF